MNESYRSCFYREEEISLPSYTYRPIFQEGVPFLPECNATVSVPCIKVVLRPVPNFCDGMPYESMESAHTEIKERIIDLQIYPVLIKFLEKEDQTASETLEDMYRAMGLRDLKREIAGMTRRATDFKWIRVEQLTVNRYDDPLTRETHDALIEFMKEYGSFQPVIVGYYNVILEGEARYLAWRSRGYERIPVIQAPIKVEYTISWWKRWWRQTFDFYL